MTRLLPILLLLLTGCANLSGTRDYVPAGTPVNPDDFGPVIISRDIYWHGITNIYGVTTLPLLMLSQSTTAAPHTVQNDLPPEPQAAPVVIQTNAVPVQRVWDTPRFRYHSGFNPSNYWGYALGSPDLRHWFTNNPTNPYDGALPPTNDWVIVRGTSGSDRFFVRMLWVPK